MKVILNPATAASFQTTPRSTAGGQTRARERRLNRKENFLPGNAASPALNQIPLCVDLDGTLVKSDTLFDSLCVLVRQKPLSVLSIPGWLAGGKANLKAKVAAAAPLDATRLPVNQAVLQFLQSQHDLGRPIYLVTGADHSLAARVADHLGLFSGVIASDGATNLVSNHKLAGLQARFPAFDYIGNSTADLPVLAHSGQVLVANPSRGLLAGLQARHLPIAQRFEDRKPALPTLLKAVRIHQWAKNILIFLPILLAHDLSLPHLWAAIQAFICFSLFASANYLINDLLDLESDRHHPRKRLRPFAAGDLSVATGLALVLLLVATTCSILPWLSPGFAIWLLIYAVSTSLYSLYLKRIALVDVLMLSGLYTLRILAGAAATQTVISPWLASFAVFLFLSLAMVKRFSELENLRERGVPSTHGRGYSTTDIEQIRSFGTSSAHAAVVVFCFYISRPDVDSLYRHSTRLWLIVPFMLYWLYRIWLLASRGELDEDPVIFAIRDPVSLVVAACIAVLAVFAAR